MLVLAVAAARGDDGSHLDAGGGADAAFEGEVTALGPSADDPEHTFTAISDNGIAKVFRVESLQGIDVGDRVSLTYQEAEVYPMEVSSIRVDRDSGDAGLK